MFLNISITGLYEKAKFNQIFHLSNGHRSLALSPTHTKNVENKSLVTIQGKHKNTVVKKKTNKKNSSISKDLQSKLIYTHILIYKVECNHNI